VGTHDKRGRVCDPADNNESQQDRYHQTCRRCVIVLFSEHGIFTS
jgi:hypothetical protein